MTEGTATDWLPIDSAPRCTPVVVWIDDEQGGHWTLAQTMGPEFGWEEADDSDARRRRVHPTHWLWIQRPNR